MTIHIVDVKLNIQTSARVQLTTATLLACDLFPYSILSTPLIPLFWLPNKTLFNCICNVMATISRTENFLFLDVLCISMS